MQPKRKTNHDQNIGSRRVFVTISNSNHFVFVIIRGAMIDKRYLIIIIYYWKCSEKIYLRCVRSKILSESIKGIINVQSYFRVLWYYSEESSGIPHFYYYTSGVSPCTPPLGLSGHHYFAKVGIWRDRGRYVIGSEIFRPRILILWIGNGSTRSCFSRSYTTAASRLDFH